MPIIPPPVRGRASIGTSNEYYDGENTNWWSGNTNNFNPGPMTMPAAPWVTAFHYSWSTAEAVEGEEYNFRESSGYEVATTEVELVPSAPPPGSPLELAGKTNKFVLLSVTAAQRDRNGPTGVPIDWSKIKVNGTFINADSNIFLKLTNSNPVTVTPSLTGEFTNYTFSVAPVAHTIVQLTFAFHPKFLENGSPPTRSELQAKFDSASLDIFGKDEDGPIGDKIPDSDPRVIPPGAAGHDTNQWNQTLYNTDDVPLYLEFVVNDGPLSTPPNGTGSYPIFPVVYEGTNCQTTNFFDVWNRIDLELLKRWGGANIKVVNTIEIDGRQLSGSAKHGSSPVSFVVARDASDWVLAHEFVHACGVYHRNQKVWMEGLDESDDTLWPIPNPGPEWHALMNGNNNIAPGGIINRAERAAIEVHLNSNP